MKILAFLIGILPQILFAQSPVRMGIAGMTHDHVNAILNQPSHEGMILVGFAEPNKELAMRLLKRAKLPETLWYPSLEKLIAEAKPTAICDFRSTVEHLETVQICAPYKIDVMVEKPLAVDLNVAKKMEELAKKHGIQLITNYETTWYASHHELKKVLSRQKETGEIRKVVIHDGHRGPKEIGCSVAFLDWLTDPVKNGGGAIMDFGCYGADLMTWLMNGQRPISVTAITQTNKPEIYPKVDDEATIIVQYAEAQAIIQASWCWPFDRKDMEVYTENGQFFADRNPNIKARIGDRDAKEDYIVAAKLQSPYNDAFSYFAAVSSGQINPEGQLGSIDINMVAMEILDAAVKSAKSGRKVIIK